jgi:hypothetical protein
VAHSPGPAFEWHPAVKHYPSRSVRTTFHYTTRNQQGENRGTGGIKCHRCKLTAELEPGTVERRCAEHCRRGTHKKQVEMVNWTPQKHVWRKSTAGLCLVEMKKKE